MENVRHIHYWESQPCYFKSNIRSIFKINPLYKKVDIDTEIITIIKQKLNNFPAETASISLSQ